MPATITSESSTSPVEFVMATVCKICAGPIEPLDHHLHCVACLGLAHAEAALDESDCGHCADRCSGPAAIWFADYSGWGSLPPACRWWAPPLLAAGAPSCRAAEPDGRPIPRFPFPRTVSAPLLTSRGSYPLATRREMTPCPSRPRRKRSPIN